MVDSFQTTLDKPKSAILTRPIPPPPTPGINIPSSTLFSSYGATGAFGPDGIIGIGSKRIFSGLISLMKCVLDKTRWITQHYV
jgi:hypothetical protein